MEDESNHSFDYYLKPRSSALDDIIKMHRLELLSLLELSTLSSDDKQRLRQLSADYVVATTPLPDEESELRRTILDNLSADIPELDGSYDMMGLRRASSREHPVTILVDGQPLTEMQLGVVYTAISPSKSALDLAERSSAYFVEPVFDDSDLVMSEHVDVEHAIERELRGDYNVDDLMPAIETRHTLMDELRPITGGLAKIGGVVLSIVT
jgi:hypothetical protein